MRRFLNAISVCIAQKRSTVPGAFSVPIFPGVARHRPRTTVDLRFLWLNHASKM